MPLFLLLVYAKGQHEDMTPDEKKRVRTLVVTLRQESGRKGDGMSKFGNELIQGLTEAVAFARGHKAGAKAHVIEMPDVRAIRRQLHMSQHEFVDAFCIPLATLKNWEQGRRAPDAAAAAYLQAIGRRLSEKLCSMLDKRSQLLAPTESFSPAAQVG